MIEPVIAQLLRACHEIPAVRRRDESEARTTATGHHARILAEQGQAAVDNLLKQLDATFQNIAHGHYK